MVGAVDSHERPTMGVKIINSPLPHGDKAEKSSSLKEAKTTGPHRG